MGENKQLQIRLRVIASGVLFLSRVFLILLYMATTANGLDER